MYSVSLFVQLPVVIHLDYVQFPPIINGVTGYFVFLSLHTLFLTYLENIWNHVNPLDCSSAVCFILAGVDLCAVGCGMPVI